MASYIDINNCAGLKGVIESINKYSNSPDIQSTSFYSVVDRIFQFFPFSALIENRNQETLSELLKILEFFLDNNNFLNNTNNCIACTLEFILTNLAFLSCEELTLLQEFLSFFCCLLLRLRYLINQQNINLNPERICKLIYEISRNNFKLKNECLQVLIELFSIHDLFYSDTDIFDLCVSEYFECLDTGIKFTDMCKLATAVLSVKPGAPISRSNFLYYWIEHEGPQIIESLKDELEIYEFLKCLSLAFETKNFNCIKLTNKYLPKIYLFEDYLKNKTLSKIMMEIFVVMLNDLVYIDFIPPFECDEPFISESHKGDYVLNTDLLILINYLKAVYARSQLNRTELSRIIARKSFSSTTFSPATLKAICYLYPIFIRPIEPSVSLSHIVISAIEKHPNLEKLISYEPQQLEWFLHSGNNMLKFRSIYYWLMNCKNNHVFMEVLEGARTYDLLLRFILNDYEDNVKRRAAEIINSVHSPQLSKILMKNIPRTIGCIGSLGYLLQANPAVPQREGKGSLFCGMMADILPGLTNIHAFSGGCLYIHKLLVQFKNNPNVVQSFFNNNKCILKIYEACSNSSENISLRSIHLLQLLMKLQQKRHQLKAVKPIYVDFTKMLTGSDTKIQKSLLLLQFALTSSSGVIQLSTKFEDILSQYLHLHEIENEEFLLKILQALILFIKKYNYLAQSPITAMFIRIQCTRIKGHQNVAMFLLFLKEVIKNVLNHKLRKTPVGEINKFLIRHKDQHNQLHLLIMKHKIFQETTGKQLINIKINAENTSLQWKNCIQNEQQNFIITFII